jgi:hypothetical protein
MLYLQQVQRVLEQQAETVQEFLFQIIRLKRQIQLVKQFLLVVPVEVEAQRMVVVEQQLQMVMEITVYLVRELRVVLLEQEEVAVVLVVAPILVVVMELAMY